MEDSEFEGEENLPNDKKNTEQPAKVQTNIVETKANRPSQKN